MYQGLVLSGGGVSCLCYADISSCFTKYTHFAGSSGGSIVATLLSAGANNNFIKQFININYLQLLDFSLGSLERLKTKFGFCKGDKLEENIGNALKKLTGNSDITFEELYKIKNKMLIVTITEVDVNECKTIYVSHLTHPNVIVKRAVRCSSSYPYIFSTKPFNYVFGENRKSVLSDGGILDNFPCSELGKYLDKNKIIGIKISHPLKEDDLNIINFSESIINTLRKPEKYCDEIVLVTNISSTNFSLSNDKKIELMNYGRREVLKVLNNCL